MMNVKPQILTSKITVFFLKKSTKVLLSRIILLELCYFLILQAENVCFLQEWCTGQLEVIMSLMPEFKNAGFWVRVNREVKKYIRLNK